MEESGVAGYLKSSKGLDRFPVIGRLHSARCDIYPTRILEIGRLFSAGYATPPAAKSSQEIT
jgi:hypothetical protein